MASDTEPEDEEAAENLLRDRFRLCTTSIAESQAKDFGLEISPTTVSCVSDLAFKYSEILAKDLALFAEHGRRKSVNGDDVIVSVHRNEHLATSMRSFNNKLKAEEPRSERKRRRRANKDDPPYVPDEPDEPDEPDY